MVRPSLLGLTITEIDMFDADFEVVESRLFVATDNSASWIGQPWMTGYPIPIDTNTLCCDTFEAFSHYTHIETKRKAVLVNFQDTIFICHYTICVT